MNVKLMSLMSDKHCGFLCVFFQNFVTKNTRLCNKWKLNEEENSDTSLAAQESEDSQKKCFLRKNVKCAVTTSYQMQWELCLGEKNLPSTKQTSYQQCQMRRSALQH